MPIRRAARGNRVADGHGGQRAELFLHFAAALFGLFRLARIGEGRRGAGRNIAEIFLGEGEAFVGFHVAENKQDGVVWGVVSLEEGLHVGEAGGVEIGEIAVEIVGVGPVAEGDRWEVKPGESAIRLIQDVDADFLLDDIALVAKVFVVDFEGAHAIGFEPEDALEGVGGNGLEIVGDVVVRGTVEGAAAGIDELDVLHFGGVGGALEHHMLEEMREAATSLGLEAEADFVVDPDGDDRSGGVGRDDDFQSVGKGCAFDGNLQCVHPSVGFNEFCVTC